MSNTIGSTYLTAQEHLHLARTLVRIMRALEQNDDVFLGAPDLFLPTIRGMSMQVETKIYNEDTSTALAVLDGQLTLPVGSKVRLDGRGYVVTELPDVYIDPANSDHVDKVTIFIGVRRPE